MKFLKSVVCCSVVMAVTSCSDSNSVAGSESSAFQSSINQTSSSSSAGLSSVDQVSSSSLPEFSSEGRDSVTEGYTCLVLDSLGNYKDCMHFTDFPDFLYNSVSEACTGYFTEYECPANEVVKCNKVYEEWLEKVTYLYEPNASEENCPAAH